MKKIFGLFIMITLALGIYAQDVNGYVDFADTSTTNAVTEYLQITTPTAITRDYSVAIAVLPTNDSGTATVTATPQGSMDGTTYIDLETAVTVNNAGTVANTKFVYPHAYFRYYRVKLISTGTGVTSFSGYLGIKR